MNAPSRPRPPKTMLLIDADNVSTDVMEQAVEALLLQFGALHVRRAYCTAESALKHQAVFKRLGIRPMVNLAAGKNSTDIALAVDALDLVIAERPEVVVIASSDSDFAPLVARLREKGCRVVGIGQQGKTGDETLTVYDDFTVLAHRKPPSRGEAGSSRARGRARTDDAAVAARPVERGVERSEPRQDPRPAGRSGSRRGGRGGGRGRAPDERPGLAPLAGAGAPAQALAPGDDDRAAAARALAVAEVMADVMAEAITDGEPASDDLVMDASAVPSEPSAPSAREEPGSTAPAPARKAPRRRSSAPAAARIAASDGLDTPSASPDQPAPQDPTPATVSEAPDARPARSRRSAAARRAALPTAEPGAATPDAAPEARLLTEPIATPASTRKRKSSPPPSALPVAAVETPPAPSPDRSPVPGRQARTRAAAAGGGSAGGASPGDAAEVAAVTAVAAPALPDRLRQILMVLPELVRGDTVELRVAAERLRDGGLLSRSGSSTKVLGAYPDKFELLPARNPNRVRLKT